MYSKFYWFVDQNLSVLTYFFYTPLTHAHSSITSTCEHTHTHTHTHVRARMRSCTYPQTRARMCILIRCLQNEESRGRWMGEKEETEREAGKYHRSEFNFVACFPQGIMNKRSFHKELLNNLLDQLLIVYVFLLLSEDCCEKRCI